MQYSNDIAITGMSGIFPGAGNLQQFWHNILHKVDATQEVPENRMDAVFFEKEEAVDRFYCRRGGFIDAFAAFDPLPFGILPLSVEGTEPEQLLALQQAHAALADAGVFEKNYPLEQASIIIGKGNYPGPGATRAIEIVRTGEQIVQVLRNLLPGVHPDELDKIKKTFQQQKGRFGADTAMGLIPNLVASLVANRLNLGGTAYTVDAACASSLVAVDHAVQLLCLRRSNLVLAGGVHLSQNAPFWSIFTQLGALSRKQQIRPFDRQADGLLIGEGCGFVVLKRLEDALREEDRIYAVIKGVGVCSDGAGASVMNPSAKGQSRAVAQAWAQAGAEVTQIGYLEAHGTATAMGDKTELETLARVFGLHPSLPRAGIGSVKSMIGHAMPAAGMAGLIKTALALYHGQLPPTLHCEEPLEAMQETRFSPVTEAREWDAAYLPKRAGVNAFGFGGINAHVVLEAWEASPAVIPAVVSVPAAASAKKDAVLLLARASRQALLHALESGEQERGEGHYRIALFHPTPERIQKAIKIVQKDIPWRNRQDLWFTNQPLLTGGGKVAFLFPGLDALAGGEVESVADYFHFPRRAMLAGMEKGILHSALHLLEKSRILDAALKQLGIVPDACAGHSMGEWLAGLSAGLVEEASVQALLQHLNPASFEMKEARFVAVGCGYAQLQPLLQEISDLYLSNDNCPQQVILCGTHAAVEKLVKVLKEQQVFHQVLPFQSGFHSPFVLDKVHLLLEGMSRIHFRQASIPLWSATTLEQYPAEYEAIRQLNVEHLIKPVRFRELTEKLYEEGVRLFIQVGSGGLTGFIDDTLKQKNYSAIASNVPVRSGLCQLQRVLAALFVEGRQVNESLLDSPLSLPIHKKTGVPLKLELGSPIVKEWPALQHLSVQRQAVVQAKELSLEEVASPLMQAFRDNCNAISGMQQEIVQLFRRQSPPAGTAVPPAPVQRMPVQRQLNISLQNCPYLIDHALLRQKPGWHCVEDMDPVIPMTMAFELLGETAQQQVSGSFVQQLLHIQVFQWMNVAQPFRAQVTGQWKSPFHAALQLEKFAQAEVVLSPTVPAAGPVIVLDTGRALDIHITPTQIYAQNMFHGPAYQGILEVKRVGDKGITGLIEGGSGKGSLLDNAGQLFGLWLQFTLEKDHVAFPVKIQQVEFFGDLHDQQGVFECTCSLTELNNEFATADFVLTRNGLTWAVIRGWQNRRLEIDERLWQVSINPLECLMAEELAPGVFLFNQAYHRVVSWDFILKRYFNQAEKKYHHALPLNKKKPWLISRVAAKDAVRSLLRQQQNLAFYPIELEIRSAASGQPYAAGEMTAGIHVSLAHKQTQAVAIARAGRPVGIDIELIEERSEGFEAIVFHPEELEWIKDKPNRAEWLTRCWVAKEAYGKYLGKGLQGNPKAYRIHAIEGDTLYIETEKITTIQHQNYIIGWTQ